MSPTPRTAVIMITVLLTVLLAVSVAKEHGWIP